MLVAIDSQIMASPMTSSRRHPYTSETTQKSQNDVDRRPSHLGKEPLKLSHICQRIKMTPIGTAVSPTVNVLNLKILYILKELRNTKASRGNTLRQRPLMCKWLRDVRLKKNQESQTKATHAKGCRFNPLGNRCLREHGIVPNMGIPFIPSRVSNFFHCLHFSNHYYFLNFRFSMFIIWVYS